MSQKPLVQFREYYYWSSRLVSKAIDDNVSDSPKRSDIRVGTSFASIGIQDQDRPHTKAAEAMQVEQLLADLTVTDLDFEGPVQFLSGCSDTVLSSLRHTAGGDTGAVNLFMDLHSSGGRRIAICLFGSAKNIEGLDPEVPAWRTFGWTSSHNNGVELLIQAGSQADRMLDPGSVWRPEPITESRSREICHNAVNISLGQGQYCHEGIKPWHRGYTLGQFTNAEWLARIYHTQYDISIGEKFDTVHVGAALWVRTPAPDAWTPFTPKTIPELDAKRIPKTL